MITNKQLREKLNKYIVERFRVFEDRASDIFGMNSPIKPIHSV